MYSNAGISRNVEKVKVTRINGIFLGENYTSINRNKVIKDYVYSPQVKLIA